MKRLLLLALGFIFLFGCSKSDNVTPILSNISFTAVIDYNAENFVCECDIQDNAFCLNVIEPQNINGLKYCLSGTEITAEFSGITYSNSINDFADNSLVVILYNVLNQVKTGVACVNGDGNYTFTDNLNCGKYTLVFSPSGLPLTLDMPDINLKINFNNVTIKP